MTSRLAVRESLSAFIVIALGAVMVLAGVYEVYFGNAYISVERGWSAFISGTILLTGGLITISLGFAIRAITGLRTALHGALAGSAGMEIAPAYSERDFIGSSPTMQRDALRLEPSSALGASLPPQALPDPVRNEPALAQTAAEHTAELPARSDTPTTDAHPAVQHHEPTVLPEHVEEDDRAALAAGWEQAPIEPTTDDWLDRSFAELGHEPPPVAQHELPEHDKPARHEPAYIEPMHHELAHHELAHHEPGATADADVEQEVFEERRLTVSDHEPNTQVSETAIAPAEEAPPTAPTSPVIGRYDAEGTSYVMYADGSIEAQSEAGVYRFASMAELKAFIEG